MVHLPCIEGVARIIEGTPGDAMVQNPALVVRPQNLEGGITMVAEVPRRRVPVNLYAPRGTTWRRHSVSWCDSGNGE
jgi:hypothetical protein